MTEVPANIRMAARLVAGAIRRIKERKRDVSLDKDAMERLINSTAKGTDNEQVKTR